MKIDVFPHILPAPYFERALQGSSSGPHITKRMRNIPVLFELEGRFRVMDRFADYQQVLTLGAPPIEDLGGPDVTPTLAMLANDGMAEIVEKYPDRFPAFVASLPMNNVDAALDEIDRAIKQLGATGIQIFTNVGGRPLDDPEFLPIFDRMAALDLPIWMHPTRSASFADYAGEPRSKYDIWWAFGWPYETTVAMSRMVFAGFFDRLPNLKVITHHMGGMLPYFENRAGGGLDQLGSRSDDPDDATARTRLKKRPLDYFHMFYADTALFGAAEPTRCGLAFFGADRVLFGTDMPFDPEKGPGFISSTIAALDGLNLSPADRTSIYEGNAQRLLKLKHCSPAPTSKAIVNAS